MNTLPSFSSLDFPCDKALSWTKAQLLKVNLRTILTFDLRATRHTPENCCCPHHGTKECDCQMVVLLVYGNASEPVTLILHGNDGQTWLSIADNPQQRADVNLIASIQQALEVNVPISISACLSSNSFCSVPPCVHEVIRSGNMRVAKQRIAIRFIISCLN